MSLFVLCFAVIPFLPLLQAVGLCLKNRENKAGIASFAAFFSWLTLIAALLLFGITLYQGPIDPHEWIDRWIVFNRFNTLMMVLIATLSLVIHHFSFAYLQADKTYRGYFQKLASLTATLLLFAVSANIVLLTIAWIAMSNLMLLLLRHQCIHPIPAGKTGEGIGEAARISACRAQRIFFIGDAAFVLASVCFALASGTTDLASGLTLLHPAGGFTQSVFFAWLAGLLWAIAAFTKTANIPFFRWLPNTMAAPTTVSAMMHAGFVNSGGLLFAKLAGFYVHFPELLLMTFVIGAITALFGSVTMLVQTDVKRYLAYSTVGQMGFMMMQCGLGAFSAAIFHLIAHSLFKSSLFLGSGDVIQRNHEKGSTGQPEPSRHKGPLSKKRAFILIILSFILPLATMALITPWLGLSGVSSLLPIFPSLTMLLAAKSLFQKRLSLFSTAMTAAVCLILVLFYTLFESGTHAILSPDVLNIGIPALERFIPVYITVSCLFLLILWIPLLRQSGLLSLRSVLADRLYVWLLNQSGGLARQSALTHRQAMLPVEYRGG